MSITRAYESDTAAVGAVSQRCLRCATWPRTRAAVAGASLLVATGCSGSQAGGGVLVPGGTTGTSAGPTSGASGIVGASGSSGTTAGVAVGGAGTLGQAGLAGAAGTPGAGPGAGGSRGVPAGAGGAAGFAGLGGLGGMSTGGTGPVAGGTPPPPGPITFLSLLSELTDRDRLAVHPRGRAPHKLLQASSYDRRSVAPNEPGWDANADWSHFIREENNQGRTERVMLDAKGPGAVTRFWTTVNPPEQGPVRFYLDGSNTPFWTGMATDLVGRNAEIGQPLSSRTIERDMLHGDARPGRNLYAPIPYAKSLKITFEDPRKNRPWAGALYYQINYRSYGPGVVVESFDPQALSSPSVAAELARVNAQLMNPDSAPRGLGNQRLTQAGMLTNGQALTQPLSGTGAIRRLRVTLNAADMTAALGDTLLELAFDGQRTARVPVGHFFGMGVAGGIKPVDLTPDKGVERLQEWYRTVDPATGQMTTYWTMPYRTGGAVAVVNQGTQPLQVALEVETGPWLWTADSMHFHAAYREEFGMPTTKQKGTDWNYVTAQGRGVYVGDTLEISKSIGGWWGEGDEKIFVDGEAFPSHFGTGTEDYYGYAWGHRENYSQPFLSQPHAGANWLDKGGTTVNSRLRSLDGIPFDTSLKLDMEVWNWHGGPVDYSVATFWYQIPAP